MLKLMQGGLLTNGNLFTPLNLYHNFIVPTLSNGLCDDLNRTLDEHPDIGLIIIDTLGHIRLGENTGQSLYAAAVGALAGLATLAQERRIAVMLVSHTRKAAGDEVKLIIGSTAEAGTVDNGLTITSGQEVYTGRFRTWGRDVSRLDKAASFSEDTGLWTLEGDYKSDVAQDFLTARIIDMLRQGPARPSTIAQQIGEVQDLGGPSSYEVG